MNMGASSVPARLWRLGSTCGRVGGGPPRGRPRSGLRDNRRHEARSAHGPGCHRLGCALIAAQQAGKRYRISFLSNDGPLPDDVRPRSERRGIPRLARGVSRAGLSGRCPDHVPLPFGRGPLQTSARACPRDRPSRSERDRRFRLPGIAGRKGGDRNASHRVRVHGGPCRSRSGVEPWAPGWKRDRHLGARGGLCGEMPAPLEGGGSCHAHQCARAR